MKNKKGVRKKRVIKWTNLLLVIGIIVLVVTSIYYAIELTKPIETSMAYTDFIEKVNNNEVEKVTIIDTEKTFNVYLTNGEEFSVINPGNDEFKLQLLEMGVNIEVRESSVKSALISTILGIPMLVVTFAIAVMVFKYLGGTNTSLFRILKNENTITFDDVAGMDDIKDEVSFAVDTLKNYKKLFEAGARPTKGIILEGPPGTGKTLIAKAIAGEAKVPFISTSGSDFIEMFAGLGASRVRALWELASVNAPCVIFIDEIDAVGRRRQTANSGAQMESNQTLNALLQKMDGLDGSSGILVIGATNLIEDLDPALLRPGRFDKKIHIGVPKTKASREEIINVHLKNKKLAPETDVADIAKLMFGLTGAEIESALNEAVIISIRHERSGEITLQDIDEAVMKLRVSGVIVNNYTEKDKYVAAVHEAGHAVMSVLKGHEVSKVSIVAYSSGVGGVTIRDMDKNPAQFKTKKDFEDEISILFGGKVAESLIFGESSIGCSNDLEKATEIATQMLGIYGMTSHNIVNIKGYGSRIPDKFYDMVNSLENSILTGTRYALVDHVDEIKRLASELMEKETVLDYTYNFQGS